MRGLTHRRRVLDATPRQILSMTPRSVWMILLAIAVGSAVFPLAWTVRSHRNLDRRAAMVRHSVATGMTPAEVVRAIKPGGTVIRADSACTAAVPAGACREMIIGASGWATPILRLTFGEDARVVAIQELPVL